MEICPFCALELTPAELKETVVYCNRIEGAAIGKPKYEHSIGQKKDHGSWSELIDPDYREAFRRRRRVRMVSVVGPTRAGKTVWLLSVGAQIQCPSPAYNDLFPLFNASILTQEAAVRDRRKENIEQFPVGTLPLRTETTVQAMTLPLWLSSGADARIAGLRHWRNGYSLLNRASRCVGAMFPNGGGRLIGDGLCFVLKDVAGETSRLIRPADSVEDAELRHLTRSDWIVFAIDAGDDDRLDDGCRSALQWLQFITTQAPAEKPKSNRWGFQGRRRERKAIIALMRVDERNDRDTALLRQVMQFPNRFRQADPDLNEQGRFKILSEYVDGMRKVQDLAQVQVRKVAPQFVKSDLPSYFSRIYYTATSSLGLTPCEVLHQDSYGEAQEGQCVTEPAMVRVMDPLIWMMIDEGKM